MLAQNCFPKRLCVCVCFCVYARSRTTKSLLFRSRYTSIVHALGIWNWFECTIHDGKNEVLIIVNALHPKQFVANISLSFSNSTLLQYCLVNLNISLIQRKIATNQPSAAVYLLNYYWFSTGYNSKDRTLMFLNCKRNRTSSLITQVIHGMVCVLIVKSAQPIGNWNWFPSFGALRALKCC